MMGGVRSRPGSEWAGPGRGEDRAGRPHAHLHAVAAQVVAEDLVGHHAALCPHRQAPLATGARLGPQQEGAQHVSPQQGEGAGPGRAAGEAEGGSDRHLASLASPGRCRTGGGGGPRVGPPGGKLLDLPSLEASKGFLTADGFKTQPGDWGRAGGEEAAAL